MGIASMVLGIIAVVLSFFSGAVVPGIIGMICGIVGLVLAIIAKKKQAKCATAGLVLCIIATAEAVIVFTACMACLGCAGAALSGLY